MYEPSRRELIDCTLKINKDNCKYLLNEYGGKRPECYDFVKIHIFDGVIHDSQAYETLTKTYGLQNDNKVTPFNVLQFKTYQFERIFVFYIKEDESAFKRRIKLEGEEAKKKGLRDPRDYG